MRTQQQHYASKKIESLLAKVSPANRPGLEAHIEYRRGQERSSENGVYSFARPVALADSLLEGRSLLSIRGADCLRLVSAFRAVYSSNSLRVRVLNLRRHIRFLHDVDDLEKSDDLGKKEGRAMEKALWVKRERDQVVGQVILDAHLDALLAGIPQRSSLKPAFPMEVRDRAILAVLRASGFRGGEFVSLNLNGVRREDTPSGPVYRLELDPEATDLKTGARTIYIADARAVSALDAWLAVHPFRTRTPRGNRWHDGTPLWVNADAGTEICARFRTEQLRRLLSKAVEWAGIAAHYTGKLTPHDFRHTCATEKARLGWNEFQLCAYFGWSPGSKTPAIYVHLKLDDQRTRILQDAQRTAQAAVAVAPQTAGAVEALVSLLRQAMGNGDSAPAPLVTVTGGGDGAAPALTLRPLAVASVAA